MMTNTQEVKYKQVITKHVDYQGENAITNKSIIHQTPLSWKMLNLIPKRCI